MIYHNEIGREIFENDEIQPFRYFEEKLTIWQSHSIGIRWNEKSILALLYQPKVVSFRPIVLQKMVLYPPF